MRYFVYLFLVCFITGCHRAVFKERWIRQKAPDTFVAMFETSKGNVEVKFVREWSPLAVDRIYAQIKHGYYDHTLFYRVPPKFVAQFGADDSVRTKRWGKYKIPDEPVLKTNERGTISFARDGKDTRGSDVFFNLRNNARLDTINFNSVKGFPVMGSVTHGMEVLDSLYSGYGDKVFSKYDTLFINKAVFLHAFPKLDSLKKAVLIRHTAK